LPLSSPVLDADGPTTIRTGSFGFVTCSICGTTGREGFNFGLDHSVRTLGSIWLLRRRPHSWPWFPEFFKALWRQSGRTGTGYVAP
jgi:hypothetical protein